MAALDRTLGPAYAPDGSTSAPETASAPPVAAISLGATGFSSALAIGHAAMAVARQNAPLQARISSSWQEHLRTPGQQEPPGFSWPYVYVR